MQHKSYGGEVTLEFQEGSHRYKVSGEYKPGVTTILSVIAKPALMLWPMSLALQLIKSKVVPSVSYTGDFILKLCELASTAHTKKSDKGKDVGHEVHSAIEEYLKVVLKTGQREKTDYIKYNLSKEADKAFRAFTKWFDEVKPKILGVEQIVYSKEYEFCGTFDCLLEIDGKVVSCDIKTNNIPRDGNPFYPEYFLQLGAYSLAYREEHGVKRIEDESKPPLEQQVTPRIDDVMIIHCSKQGNCTTKRASEVGKTVEDCEQGFINTFKLRQFLESIKRGGK